MHAGKNVDAVRFPPARDFGGKAGPAARGRSGRHHAPGALLRASGSL